MQPTSQFELANHYMVPIAAGKLDVVIGLHPLGWYNGPFQAKGFHLWASQPTSTATATTQTPTASSTPTRTPSPAPTPTPSTVTGRCELFLNASGDPLNGQWMGVPAPATLERWWLGPNGWELISSLPLPDPVLTTREACS
jgi:hypothetical protein